MSSRVLPRLARPDIERRPLPGGGFVLTSRETLREPVANLGTWLTRWGRERPTGIALAERAPDGRWRTLSWWEAHTHARGLAQALLDRRLSGERPVMILSGNSLDHACLMFAGLLVGVPVVPVSTAYSLRSGDHAQLKHIAALVTPGLVFAEQGATYAQALAALDLPSDVEIVTSDLRRSGVGTVGYHTLLGTTVGADLEERVRAVGPQTVAKILLTSGSTGRPKGVVNTHGMLTANQQALAQAWPFLDEQPPVIVDWLPWSHTFGGNHNLNLILRTGGTLYIDEGRPAPGLFAPTIANLREIAPTLQFNVPAGYAMLAQALEADEELRRTFFSRLQGVFYAAAALPQATWEHLDRLAERTLGHRVWMTTSWGSTETSPLVTSAHFASEDAGNIGVPVPGCALKFVPNGQKLELRVRGPNVTPGYHRDPALGAAAFDEDGFYQIGDAGTLVDPEDPSAGVRFDGRVAEDFKLESGTWVNVGEVRTRALSALNGLVTSAVVAGHGRDEVVLLAWLDAALAGQIAAGDPATDPAIHAAIRAGLRAYNDGQGASRRVARVLLLTDPPALDGGEITDKGYVNARAVLANRPDDVERCFAVGPRAANLVEI